MGRKKKVPLWRLWEEEPEHISRVILREFEQYAIDNGYQPSPHGLFRMLTEGYWHLKLRKFIEPRYDFTQGSFDHWYDRLVEEGYMSVDEHTHALKSNWLVIEEKDGRPPELE